MHIAIMKESKFEFRQNDFKIYDLDTHDSDSKMRNPFIYFTKTRSSN